MKPSINNFSPASTLMEKQARRARQVRQAGRKAGRQEGRKAGRQEGRKAGRQEGVPGRSEQTNKQTTNKHQTSACFSRTGIGIKSLREANASFYFVL
jgi:predicted transposase YdaD